MIFGIDKLALNFFTSVKIRETVMSRYYWFHRNDVNAIELNDKEMCKCVVWLRNKERTEKIEILLGAVIFNCSCNLSK